MNQPALIALTRKVSSSIVQCELTHLDRQVIDIGQARIQHDAYEKCLTESGCQVISLPEEPDMPDSVFVEDTAVVLDELAVILRPGADPRKLETATITDALKPFRTLFHINHPGTLDGGDVLHIDKTLYVGLSGRSNEEGVAQLRNILKPFGYDVVGVEVKGCLHLKSAVTQVADDTLLINKKWVDPAVFSRMKLIEVDPSEPYAANAVWINGIVMYPVSFPKTMERLQKAGIKLRIVDASELAKAEGALTCCSLIFKK